MGTFVNKEITKKQEYDFWGCILSRGFLLIRNNCSYDWMQSVVSRFYARMKLNYVTDCRQRGKASQKFILVGR